MFQDSRQDFDDYFPFRLIYAFHMPLFIFLSGAVTATKPSAIMSQGLGWRTRIALTGHAINHSAIRLLIPFCSWTMIGWYVNYRHTYRWFEWAAIVIKSPDNSIWFLLLIFQCLFFWYAWNLAMGLVLGYLHTKNTRFLTFCLEQRFVQIAFFYYIFNKILFLPEITNSYGIGSVKISLGYFALGMLYYVYARNYMRGFWRVAPYVIFIALVPFWYRTHPGPLSGWMGKFMDPGSADQDFRTLMAICGILITLDVVRIIRAAKSTIVDRSLAYCGTASLGIYAMHFYLLGYPPLFILPLAGSLLAYAILSHIPLLRTVLLGEKHALQPSLDQC
jgi:fucose 4-O-acetylase-like acetyltransferase